MRLSKTISATDAAPIMAAKSWLADAHLPAALPLIDLSQAAPTDPPPAPLRAHIAERAQTHDSAHLYGPVLGLPELRAAVASDWSRHYGVSIPSGHVAITSGCNQAFCAAVSAVAAPGDNIVLPAPWYFNHKMHLDMAGVETRALGCSAQMLPCPKSAAGLIDARTAALVLVSPNNPTGAQYPVQLISEFADLARDAGIALIIDETYRDYRSSDAPGHALFERPDWADVAIHLYSFSKCYRLTGHRVGALIAGGRVINEVEKYLDTVSICANQLAQHAALFGLEHLQEFLEQDRQEMRHRREAAETLLNTASTRVLSCGAFFATVAHNFDAPSEEVARAMLTREGVLCLPMSMFAPNDDPLAQRALRIAFANVDSARLKEASQRIDRFARTGGLVLRACSA